MNINKIITESINKIIVENTQALFQQLSTSYNRLYQYRMKIKNTNLKATNNKEIVSFVGHELYNFVAALEKAIQRCVYSNNINESSWIPSLENWGFKVPQELNAGINTGERYYWKVKNSLNRNFGTNSQNVSGNQKGYNVTGNEKLIYLLDTVWPKIQKDYVRIDGQYNLNKMCPVAVYVKNEIEAVYQTVKIIRTNAAANQNTNTNTNQNTTNAQGTNP